MTNKIKYNLYLLRKYGLGVQLVHTFNTMQEAITYIKDSDLEKIDYDRWWIWETMEDATIIGEYTYWDLIEELEDA